MTSTLRFDHDALREIREALSLSYAGFARRVSEFGGSVTDVTIKNWETGRTSPTATDLASVCNAVGVHPSKFFKAEEPAKAGAR